MTCKAKTKSGKRCSRKAVAGDYCRQHADLQKSKSSLNFSTIIKGMVVVGTVLIFLMDIFDFFDLKKPISYLNISHTETVSFLDTSLFNVAILPFFPTKDCTIEDTEYEKQLLIRLDEIGALEDGKTEYKLFELEKFLPTERAVLDFGTVNNADLVVWGMYDEDCETENKIRIRYNFTSNHKLNFGNLFAQKGDSGFITLTKDQSILQGSLQEDLEFLLFWTSGIAAMLNQEAAKAFDLFDKINSNNCNADLEYARIIALSMARDRIDQNKVSNTLFRVSQCKDLWPSTYYSIGTAYYLDYIIAQLADLEED
ncbi:MAG: DUF5763 domain-containing protein, partial [Bacteroidota bacterium]